MAEVGTTWLLRIRTDYMRDVARQLARQPEVGKRWYDEFLSGQHDDDDPDSTFDGSIDMAGTEELREVICCLAELPRQQYEVDLYCRFSDEERGVRGEVGMLSRYWPDTRFARIQIEERDGVIEAAARKAKAILGAAIG